jgi:hypothetical protein
LRLKLTAARTKKIMNTIKLLILIIIAAIIGAGQIHAIEPGTYSVSLVSCDCKGGKNPYRGIVLHIDEKGVARVQISRLKHSEKIQVDSVSITEGKIKNSFVLIVRWTLRKEVGIPGELSEFRQILCLTFNGENGSGSNLIVDDSSAECLQALIGAIER